MTFSTKSIFRYVIYVTQKKLHAKKEEKLLKRFWDRPLPPSILTDGRTDRRTTDKSVLEKLRCLSAGGAKKEIAIRPLIIDQYLKRAVL